MENIVIVTNAYPWQRISDDIFGTQAEFESDALELNTSICKGLLTGKLKAVTSNGIPMKSPLELSDLKNAHVTSEDMNQWLHSEGFRITWDPAASEAASTKLTTGTEKRWTEEMIMEMIAFENDLKSKGVKDYAQKTAKHYGVDPSRLRQIKRDFYKNSQPEKQMPAFSSTYRSR